jgi:hypothetical protein
MKKLLTLTLVLVTLTLMGTEVMAQTRTINLNTGYDQWSNTKIDVGQQDNEWRVIFDSTNQPLPAPPATGRPADVVSDEGWNANPSLAINFPKSRWISIKPNQGSPLPLPPNAFQYAFYFTLPVGSSSPQLTMKLSADDRITKVTLNGCSFSTGSGGVFNQNPPLGVNTSLLSCFNTGPTVNVITVYVADTGAIITGLIVDGTVTYEDCNRRPIREIPGLTSITFWESTFAAPTQHTFAKGGPELTARLSGPLTTGNSDFESLPGIESYDVFYSTWDGTFDANGQFVTIEADVNNTGAPLGGGLNLARVDFNGTGQFANSVSSFVALGNNAMPNDVGKAVDGLTSTDTTMGNTIDQAQRVRVTVGFPCSRVPPPTGTVFTGRVIDQQNRPVRGTLVQVPGRMPTRTNANGTFTFDNLALTERLAISFSASGFVDTTRVFPVRPGVLNATDTVLLRRAPAVVINATNGGRVTFASGGGLTIPPRSLVDPVGNLLTGDVRVSLTYLDVSDPKQIRSAPGDFTALMRDKSVRTLESFGIFEAYVEDLGGRRADLAPGKTAIINLPIPRRNLGNVPRTIGLFSFGTINGRWIEAGTLIRSNDGLTYNGTIDTLDVNWNGDDPVDTTCIRVQVFEPHFPNPPHGSPAVNSHVTATGVSYNGSSDGYTDSNGFVCLLVKRNSQVSLQAFSTQVSSYVSVPIVITTPNIASGAADCGNLARCPLVQEIDLDIIVGGLRPENFYDIVKRRDRQFEVLRRQLGGRFDVEEGTGYGKYQEWVGHWEPLVYPHGRFEIAYDAMNRIARQPDQPTQPPYCNAWKELGPFDTPVGDSGRGVGQVHWIDFDPNNPNNLFTGSALGGLFYSIDAGATWKSGGTDFLEPNIGAAHVAVDPKDATGSTWLLATGDGDGHPMDGVGSGQNTSHGVYRTTDKGKRWVKIGLDFTNDWSHVPVWWTFQIKKLLFAPDNSGTIWAATNFGLFKTTIANDPSGFDDWELVPTGENNGNPANDDSFYDIEYRPGDPSTLYASGSTLVRSLDGGDTWNPLPGIPFLPDSDAGRIAMEVTPANPDYLYVVVVTKDPAECNGSADDVPRSWLYRFDANSGSWTDKGPICNTGSYEPTQRGVHFSRAQSIGVSPIDPNLIFIGDVKMAKCTTGGDPNFCNWIQTASTLHDDIHQVKFAPIDANNPNGLTIYAAHDGGVSKTVDGGINWTNQSNGLAVAWVMRMSTSATDPKLILAGLFDEGTVLYNGSTWRQVFGGDGLTPIIDHIDPTNMFVSRQSGHVRRSADKGVSFPFFANPGCASNWHTFVILNSVDTQTIFGACLPEVRRSTKRGEPRSWSTISDFTSVGLGDLQVWKLYTALSDPNYLYAHLVHGTKPQPLMRTKNANADPSEVEWDPILPPSNQWISDMAVDVDPNKFWITYTGGPNKVQYYNGNSYINLTTNLDPSLTVNSIVPRRGTDQLFIGTSRGVYSGRGATPNWTRLGTPTVGEMPFIEVGDIEINYVNNKLRAATRGRGVWEIPLDPCARTEICVVKFADKNENGVQDTGEQALPGWTFQIKDAPGNIVATVTTGDPKNTCAVVPAPETYTISEVLQPGWISTTPNPKTVTVSAGNRVNLSFGNKFNCPSITLNPPSGSLITTEFGTFYSQTITATGGCASSFTYRVTSGVVPPGLTLGANGVLSGTTSQWGTFDFTVTATDSCGCSQSQNYTLTVLPDWDRFRRGMNEFCVWGGGGGGSYNSQTQIDNPYAVTADNAFRPSNNRGVRFGAIGLCYGRILLANDRFAFKYTFNAIPVAVLSYPDINRDLGIQVPGSETRRNVFGAGLSPIGFQLYFRPQNRLKPFVSTSGGFIFFGDPVPRLNGSRFNFTYDFGGGVQIFRDSRRAFTFGYKYQRLSNGGRALNNPGFDGHVVYFGYSIFK